MKKVFLILLITFSFADLKIKTENNELIKEIAQKDAMEDINLFKYRESYYVPEERILNFYKNYSPEYYQLYEYIYLKSVDNYYHHNKEDDDLDAVAPALFCGVLSPFIIAGIISILKNFVGAIVSAGSAGG